MFWGGGKNECSPRTAPLCAAAAIAAIAAIATLTAAAWRPPLAHADGGSSARNNPSASAPDQPPATPRAYAQRILRALADRHANNWVRYWQARADCAAARRAHAAAPLDRVLLTLTAAICAHIDARLGVNPADYPPRGEERGEGLLLNEPDAAAGYTLFSLWGATRTVYLIDPLGRIAHTWHVNFNPQKRRFINHAKLLDNGNLMIMANHRILEIDPRGSIVRLYRGGGHHDFLKMPNGNALILFQARKSREEAIAAGANPEFVSEIGLLYDYILEVRPTDANGGKRVRVWEWSVWDHLIQDFDPTKPNYGAIAEHPELIDLNYLLETLNKSHRAGELTHINAIDYNPALDQIMLSPRHYSELWIIDHSATTEEARGHSGGNGGMGGDLLYRWGNPRAYGQGDAADQRLFWQHHTHWIPPGLPGAGNILVFNNGSEFSDHWRGYSSIDEIVPPVDGYRYRRDPNSPYPPAEPAWTYAAPTPEDFNAGHISGAQRLPNGNTLIADGPAGTIFQVTPDGRTVWKYIVPRHYHISLWQESGAPARLTHGNAADEPSPTIKNDIYRAYWYPPDHPGLQYLDLAPGEYLEDTPDLFDWALDAILAGDFGERLADAHFDIYIYENILIYLKRHCAEEDTQAPFFLNSFPADARHLPARWRERGFEGRSFNFGGNNVHSVGDWCIAITSLPSYPIERVSAGQYTDEGRVWQAEITLNE